MKNTSLQTSARSFTPCPHLTKPPLCRCPLWTAPEEDQSYIGLSLLASPFSVKREELFLFHKLCVTRNYYSTLSIYGIYIAPLQGNYSEALPGPRENKSFKELVKRAGQIPCKRADLIH